MQRTILIKYKGKTYFIDYLNSDGQILSLLNRDYWEIKNENQEELQIYEFQNTSKKEKEKIRKTRILHSKLINFCTRHFNDYNPKT